MNRDPITVTIQPSTVGSPENVDVWIRSSRGMQVFSDLSPEDIEALTDALEEA